MKKTFKNLKLLSLFALSLGLVACANNNNEEDNIKEETKKEVTIKSYNASKELVDLTLPFNPERIAILDMASLDIIDALGLGDRVVGSSNVSIDYLSKYNPSETNGIVNLGTIKNADLVEVKASKPDIIFIGGRLSSVYEDLKEIAPVVYLGTDTEKGVVESTLTNLETIATIFGKEETVTNLYNTYSFESRISDIQTNFKDKNALVGMYSGSSFNLLDNTGRCSIIGKELGFNNIKNGELSGATHGDSASWEAIKALDPEYIFVMDRNSAIGQEATVSTKEAIENEIIKTMDVYKNNKICYLEHPNIWYTAEGGVNALDTMLKDVENFLVNHK